MESIGNQDGVVVPRQPFETYRDTFRRERELDRQALEAQSGKVASCTNVEAYPETGASLRARAQGPQVTETDMVAVNAGSRAAFRTAMTFLLTGGVGVAGAILKVGAAANVPSWGQIVCYTACVIAGGGYGGANECAEVCFH